MRLSFQEIRNRAIAFAHEWHDETSERSEAQSFWNDFFNVFGIHRRSVASFEKTVKNLHGGYDRIDVIWQGVLIGEHKSRGQDLSKAELQAVRYLQALAQDPKSDVPPRYIVVSDFARIVLHDLEATDPDEGSFEFPTTDVHKHIRRFDFLNGIQSKPADPEDPINIQAVEVLGELHDALEKSGYSGHQLERFLVRVLFCLFAEDTGIFEPDTFKSLVDQSREDGSDLGPLLERLFRVLDTEENKRPKNTPDHLIGLPYVNGDLFAERHELAEFDRETREALLHATRFQWAKISPAVFGSLFQSIMAGEAGARRRRQIGAHYTSERDIMKLIRSLFLDDLRAEFDKAKRKRSDLMKVHDKLTRLKFLDPACGCGNFLVVAYRELRRLEHEVIEALFPDHGLIEINDVVRMDVDQMHGIEIEEWPARIAEVAMWLIDHQMNQEASQKFGKPLLRLPLKKSAKIVHANALRFDWNEVLPASECSFVMGNPPFVGSKYQSGDQKADFAHVAGHIPTFGLLDFVTAWYIKATDYIQAGEPDLQVAFVSTNSITQGEQVGVLWPALLSRGIRIRFAYRTFSWESEARGAAHVHVVIVGFCRDPKVTRTIVDILEDGTESVTNARNVNPYLIDAPDIAIQNRSQPLCNVPEIGIGNKPIDDGNFLFTDEGKDAFIRAEPSAKRYFRKWLGADEFINGWHRWCLWLGDAEPSELRKLPLAMSRVEAVRNFRLRSRSAGTRAIADKPTRFHVENFPRSTYLLIPSVSSERRNYIPIGFIPPDVMASNLVLVIPDATLYHFAVLSSTMHMAWVRQICGRLKSDYRYSAKLVYNNYPWPSDITDAKKEAVEEAAQSVLDAREEFPDQTLADLYDPVAMPKLLRDAHRKLDRAVDKCYRSQPFESDRQRVEFLFGLYEQLTAPLTSKPARKSRRRKVEE